MLKLDQISVALFFYAILLIAAHRDAPIPMPCAFPYGDVMNKKMFMGEMLSTPEKIQYSLAFLLIGIISRIIPHMPNATAIIFSSLAVGFLLPRSYALLGTLLMAVVSDFLLAKIYGYPAYGSWSFFTYSGFFAIAYFGSTLHKINKLGSFVWLLTSSLGFWLWSNFGVWLSAGLYAKTFSGLVVCYLAALPFLQNQIIGDVIWLGSFIGVLALRKFSKTILITRTSNHLSS